MRLLPPQIRAGIEDPNDPDPLIAFVTLTHADWEAPLRFVSDADGIDYMLGSDRFKGFPFEIVMLTDGETAPRGRIAVQNVDRAIGEAIKAISSAPGVALKLYAALDFDSTVIPRVAFGTPQLILEATNLYFRQLSLDVLSASGVLTSWDYVSQPWPSKFATQALLPGLFR